ncbi:metallophosphoesterase [Stakelama tenebrarum]|uniref:Serine/threonine protein phosphatase n=1 Tax=Stakelama tenebrarum TaxID=2711215 RepID=A0A6G6Y3R3_9SPHN|nr:metallophosphoesterase [Sphingosinithalassobacter tenebrarum]QIG79555.1 serine/threonine protein phosphatase [Sphingosinithalassobacter tenebrarum]
MIGRLLNRRAPAGLRGRSISTLGKRVYAIGDIHGRADLLEDLLARIEADHFARGEAPVQLIFLGDLVDRGPDSAKVVKRLMQIRREHEDTHFLMGNHEEVFLLALEGNMEALRLFDRIGGRQTMQSYGISDHALMRADFEELSGILAEHIPQDHVDFLAGFEDLIVVGDYAFVHAGIDPRKPLAEQSKGDLRWIRTRFLDHRQPFEKVIVHGHTITPEVDWRPNRIGIDTGAFVSGTLTALGLEGEERWLLQAQASA